MYEININIPKKRIGVINKIRKLLKTSYESANVKNRGEISETTMNKAGSMKEVGITFDVKEIEKS